METVERRRRRRPKRRLTDAAKEDTQAVGARVEGPENSAKEKMKRPEGHPSGRETGPSTRAQYVGDERSGLLF